MKIYIVFFVLLTVVTLINCHATQSGNFYGFPGTVELLRNSRKSRVSKEFAVDDEAATDASSGQDTGKLLKNFQPYLDDRDTDKLTDQQKGLLKGIADRIARFGPQLNDGHDTDASLSETELGEGRATKSNKNSKSGKQRVAAATTTNKSAPKSKTIQSSSTSTQRPKVNPTKKQQVAQIDADNSDTDDMSSTINDNNATASAIIDALSRENAREDFYVRERPQTEMNKLKKSPLTVQQPAGGATNANGTGKPTKYHYYPHNQHIYLLPECAIQQVCNAVYVRLNYTQPLCACPSRYRDPCSASLNEDDLHTTKLIGDANRKAVTLAKTCEATTEMRECRAPKDWSLLALQNTRTGKSHYLVICRCPDHFRLEGPMAHDQPTYASVPGIRVFGMMCVKPGVQIRRPTTSQDLPPNKRFQDNQYYHNKYKVTSLPPYRPTTLSTTPAISLAQANDYIQTQYQSNYQYLKRPGSPIQKPNSNILKQGNLPTLSYGRSGNPDGGEEITADEQTESIQDAESRSKRSANEYSADDEADYMPEFPWDRVRELQRSLHWF